MNAVMLSVNSACLAVYQSSPGKIKHIIIPYIYNYIGRIAFFTYGTALQVLGANSPFAALFGLHDVARRRCSRHL